MSETTLKPLERRKVRGFTPERTIHQGPNWSETKSIVLVRELKVRPTPKISCLIVYGYLRYIKTCDRTLGVLVRVILVK